MTLKFHHIQEVLTSGQTTKCLSWSAYKDAYAFTYYAGWADDVERWFVTGPHDWYVARHGLTTDQLIDLLNAEGVRYVYGVGAMTQLYMGGPRP